MIEIPRYPKDVIRAHAPHNGYPNDRDADGYEDVSLTRPHRCAIQAYMDAHGVSQLMAATILIEQCTEANNAAKAAAEAAFEASL